MPPSALSRQSGLGAKWSAVEARLAGGFFIQKTNVFVELRKSVFIKPSSGSAGEPLG